MTPAPASVTPPTAASGFASVSGIVGLVTVVIGLGLISPGAVAG